MANKEARSSQKIQFMRLAEPFDLSEIKWRVIHTNEDGSRGAVVAFADPRAYADRLNQLFTPTGWTRTYEVSTVSSLSRMKRNRLIQTGKVLVTCILTINGVGCHSGSGEEWADEDNAMTAAEAQAFKRACSCFELGRYLYNLTETWVPLNRYRQPVQFPQLPEWALPKTDGNGKGHPASEPRPRKTYRGPIDQETTSRIERFRRILGEGIYGEILWRAGHARRASDIPNSLLQGNVSEAMERASRGVRRATELASQIDAVSSLALMDKLQIESLTRIPGLESLRNLVAELERDAARPNVVLSEASQPESTTHES